MSTKRLQEILGDGAGEFVSKLEGDATGGTNKDAGEGDAPPAGEGEGDAPPVLKLSETVKAESLQHLGVVIKALIDVAKAIDSAEVASEGGDALPDEIKTIVRSSSQVLGKMLGEGAGEGEGEGEQGKAAAPNAAGDVTKAKLDDFSSTLDTLGGVIENLQTALGVKSPAADGSESKNEKNDPEIAKALTGIASILKRQGAAITDLRERVGLPSALPAEGRRVQKAARQDEFDGWPLDMNESRRRAAR